MTSSILLPVSTSAVAMIVRLPPSSVLRAAPKNFFGLCSALESTPPERILPDGGTTGLYALARGGPDGMFPRRERGDRIEQDDHVASVLDQPPRFLNDHLCDLHVTGRRL